MALKPWTFFSLGVTEEDVKSYLGDDMTLEKAIEKKRLYKVDLKANEEIGAQNGLEVGAGARDNSQARKGLP